MGERPTAFIAKSPVVFAVFSVKIIAYGVLNEIDVYEKNNF